MNRASLCLYVLRDLGKQMHVYVQQCPHKSCAGGYRQYLAYPAVPCYYLTKVRHCKQRVPISCGMRAVRRLLNASGFGAAQRYTAIGAKLAHYVLKLEGKRSCLCLLVSAFNGINSGYSMML